MLKEKGSNCKKCKHYKKGRTRKPCAECSEIFNSNYEFDTKQMIFRNDSTCTLTFQITPSKKDKSVAYFSVKNSDGNELLCVDSKEVNNTSITGLISSWTIYRFVECIIFCLLHESQMKGENHDTAR